jgi:hypothetical protein
VSNERSAAKVAKLLVGVGHFPDQLDQVRLKITGIVNKTLKKYKKLSNPKEKLKFLTICDEPFALPPPALVRPQPSPQATAAAPEIPSPIKTRQVRHCPGCLRLRMLLCQQSKAVNQKLFSQKTRVKHLRGQCSSLKSIKVKVLNQKLRRRDETIKNLKEELHLLRSNQGKSELRTLQKKVKRKEKYEKNEKKNKDEESTNSVIAELQLKIEDKDSTIRRLEQEMLLLQDEIEEFKAEMEFKSKYNKKEYDVNLRIMAYDAISFSVPTENIPLLITRYSKYLGVPVTSAPHRTTIDRMVRELGALSDYQSAKLLCDTEGNGII